MYYRLQTDVASMSQYWEQLNDKHVRTSRGRSLSIQDDAIEVPFRFSVRYSPGLDGDPKQQPLYDFVPNTNTMHKRMVEALLGSGVDNLQTFPALVTDTGSGATSEDYLVVNVVGLVSCARMDKSDAIPLAGRYFFNKLVLDPASVKDQLLFRVKESPMDIVIHDKVAQALQRGQFAGVILEPLQQAP